jgi:hypothetical protein
LDILSLIPTHFSSQKDRLQASFVCRHWRRTFLRCADLWSRLYLSKGEVYVKTLLERAKGTALDMIVDGGVPIGTMALLSSHTEQIKDLAFPVNNWADVQNFSEANSGPFPLLGALRIEIYTGVNGLDFSATKPPSSPLFSNAVNLKVFHFHSNSGWPPSLNSFIFPNLASVQLSVTRTHDFFALQLLDFLEASPMLRTVDMEIIADISLQGVPQGRVVVLASVQNFSLTVSDAGPGYKVVAHLSSPSVRSTSFMHKKSTADAIPEEIFPPSISWSAIVRQYTRSPIEEVALEITINTFMTCKLTFRSADAAVIELYFEVTNEDDDPSILPSVEMHHEVFTQATRAIRNHLQLASINRLHICHSLDDVDTIRLQYIANEVGSLFKSVGSLDELTIYHCDLRPYLPSFLDPEEGYIWEPVVFPPVKELTISHPFCPDEEEWTAIVELAKSQHVLGIPFERMVIRGERVFAGMEERLGPWVSSVECVVDEVCTDDD